MPRGQGSKRVKWTKAVGGQRSVRRGSVMDRQGERQEGAMSRGFIEGWHEDLGLWEFSYPDPNRFSSLCSPAEPAIALGNSPKLSVPRFLNLLKDSWTTSKREDTSSSDM